MGRSLGRAATLAVWVALVAAGQCWGAAAVLGSFSNAANAERHRGELEARTGLDARVVVVPERPGSTYRVIADADDEAAARALVRRAGKLGVEGAWYWADAPVAASAAPVVAAPARPVADAPDPVTEAGPADSEPLPTVPVAGLRLASAGEVIEAPRFEDVDIQIDGRLDEAIWAEVPGYEEMVVVEPDTLAQPRFRTVVKFLYTPRGLYASSWNEQPKETLIARLSSRDDSINRDGWSLILDTSGEGLYGYWFSVNLGGSVMDGKVAPERNFSREWDGPWEGAAAAVDGGWSAEMFLPWSMMTMPQTAGDRQMGYYSTRKVAYIDERWGWPALPPTGARFMSALQPLGVAEVTPRKQFAVFPYAASSQDFGDRDEGYKAGTDIFWRPSSNFQITAALSPDFGAVESDDVVVNLTARETYFPEKRLFFLEGGEIFATSGRSATSSNIRRSGDIMSSSGGSRRTRSAFQRTPSTVLNTRRIGGAPILAYHEDVEVDGHRLSQPTELLGAAKVTGQAGPVRYGVLTAFEDDAEVVASVPGADGAMAETTVAGTGRDFGIARFLYERSGAGRQAIGYIGTHLDHPLQRATVHGVDLQLLSANGKLRTEMQTLASDVRCTPAGDAMVRKPACPDAADGTTGYGGWADIYYTPRRGMQHALRLDYFDESLDINGLGFLERNDQYGGFYSFSLVRTNLWGLRSLGTSVSAANWLNLDGQNTRTGIFLQNIIAFHNRSEVRTALRYFPARWEDLESRGNGAYRIGSRTGAEFAIGSDTSRRVSWSLQFASLGEDLGGVSYTGGVGVTFKPLDRFSLDFDLRYQKRDGWLRYVWNDADFTTFEARDVQPQIAADLFINARQQLRFTMQWAGIRAREQERFRIVDGFDELQPRYREEGTDNDDFTISRLTAQLRYRWELAPLSDLFVVYTRGSNLANAYDLDDPLAMPRDGFGDLYRDALTSPLVDVLVVKFRYRIGG